MILDRVTMTGADDSIDPTDLIPLARDFPWVEWGILFSGTRLGVPRYPSKRWIDALARVVLQVPMKLSAHLCGAWVRDLVLQGKFTWREAFRAHYPLFARIQLNFHGQFHKKGPGFETVLTDETPQGASPGQKGRAGKQFIFQCDGPNDPTVVELQPWFPEGVVPLFDRSGGAGIVPAEWPKAWPGVYCGYAGGLGPDNLNGQLQLIDRAAVGERVWIDMETRVRSDDDREFDLGKVRRALEQTSVWVKNPAREAK
jgi:hypothetical protein